jgi:hypothetical protein
MSVDEAHCGRCKIARSINDAADRERTRGARSDRAANWLPHTSPAEFHAQHRGCAVIGPNGRRGIIGRIARM